jgi:hypothetical protein
MDNVDDAEAAKPFAYVVGPDAADPWAPPAEWRFKTGDARLIAAAPDLLAALVELEETIRYSEHRFESPKGLAHARAAIAKAKGEA